MSALTIGSLFSGIGGLELGVEHATGGRVLWQVEKDKFCREILARHWPHAVRHDDVCTVNGLPRVDILCGGFPCQDVSVAGKRAGFAGEQSSLWREYRRIIADVRPRFIFVENVPGLFTADDGWAFGEVLGDLAALGFDATWDVFRASDVGAPHRRERVFLLAYRDGERCERQRVGGLLDGEREAFGHDADECGGADAGLADAIGFDAERHGRPGIVARASGEAQGEASQRQRSGNAARGSSEDRRSELRRAAGGGRFNGRGGAEPGVGGDTDGLPRGLDGHRWPDGRGQPQHEGEPPRTAHGVARRAGRLKALGNAVVPQVAALAWRVLYARAQEAM